MLVPGYFGERLALVWLVPLVQLLRVGLGVFFVLVTLLSSLADFIPKSRHFFNLDVTLGSFAQFVHGTGCLFA